MQGIRCAGAHAMPLVPALALLLSLFGVPQPLRATLADDVSIQASVAGLFVGEQEIVDGTVVAAERDANTVRLHLGKAPGALTVSLIIPLLSNFPAQPERYYLGRDVRVSGLIRSFRGAPEMVIRDPADIQVLGAVSPVPAPSPVIAAHPTREPAGDTADQDLRHRIDELGQLVRHLEERVQELERTRSTDTAE
jgi:hypothetical protein